MMPHRTDTMLGRMRWGQIALVLLATSGIATWGQNSNPTQSPSTRMDRIAGRIVSARDGSLLDRARVSIQRVDSPQNPPQFVVTGADGRFDFEQLAPGKYSLFGARRGFLDAAYDQHEQFSTAIVTGAGLDTENLNLRLEPMATISGRVMDEAGEPARKARVNVYRDINQSGQARTRTMASTQTDDLGNFEVTPLAPGNYFVSAATTPWYAIHPPSANSSGNGATAAVSVERNLDVAYPTAFYANASDIEDATPVPLKGGDRVDVEIHMSPARAMRLLFRQPPSNEQSGFQMPSLQKRTADGYEPAPTEMHSLGGDLYEISGLPEGKYKVQMKLPGQPAKTSELSVTADGQELDASAGEASGSLKATVMQADAGKLPAELGVILLDSSRKPIAGRPVSEKGEATFDDLEPGEYFLGVGGPSRAYTITSVVSEGTQVAGHPVKIAAGSQRNVSLMVASGASSVKGFVRRDGVPAAGAMVVLVPNDWKSNSDLFRRDQSDLDGSFELRSVVAGTYKIVAIEDGWKLEWARPTVIAHYLPLAQALTVTAANQPVELTAPVILQSE